MTNRSSRGSEQPEKAVALRRSINDRDLIRELHQGQRSCGRTPRPNTWLHPTKASKDQNPLATQAPTTHGLIGNRRPDMRRPRMPINIRGPAHGHIDNVGAASVDHSRFQTKASRRRGFRHARAQPRKTLRPETAQQCSQGLRDLYDRRSDCNRPDTQLLRLPDLCQKLASRYADHSHPRQEDWEPSRTWLLCVEFHCRPRLLESKTNIPISCSRARGKIVSGC
jgi:hypothetical protein